MVESGTGNGVLVRKDAALVSAAVSAAVGAVVYGLRKALAEGEAGLPLGRQEETAEGESGGSDSLLATVWESASGALLPLADEMAEAAGRWTAKHSPAVIRDRLLPRFIESFQDAS
jgi:hypothetical protein